MSLPRVLVLTRTSALGGAERLLANALPHLGRDRFHYAFAAFDGHGPLAAAVRQAGIPFSVWPHPGVLDPRNLRALRRRLRAEGIALLHAHLPLAGVAARIAAQGLPTRVLYTEHNTPEGYHPLAQGLNRLTWSWQDGAIAVSERVRSGCPGPPGCEPGRLAVIPNGVDLAALDREAARGPRAALPAEPSEAFVALVPATLARRKGHDVLLRALAQMPEAGRRRLSVWLAGDGPEQARLAGLAARLGVGDHLRWLGRRPDVFALMRRAHAVVLPSRTEGHPLALLEAQALGCAVVATAVGGVPEVVETERTGLLVPSEAPRALAQALARLCGDPTLRARLGATASARARARFDVRRHVAQVEAFYARCMAFPPRTGRLPLRPPEPQEEASCTAAPASSAAPSSSPWPSPPPPAW